jgi:hypothetical protein
LGPGSAPRHNAPGINPVRLSVARLGRDDKVGVDLIELRAGQMIIPVNANHV